MGMVLLVGLSVSCAGCFRHCCLRRARRGFVLRGNFALEFNRVPWVHSRTEVCDERSELSAQLNAQGCGTCVQPVEVAGPPVEAGACQGTTGEMPCTACVGPVRAALINLGSLGWRLRAGRGPAVSEGPEAISRFHPVPTREVFSRRDWMLGPAPASPWTAGNAAGVPSASGGQPVPLGPLPAAPAPEELDSLPAEPAPPGSGVEGQQARMSSGARAVRRWMFMAPEPRQLDPVAAVPRSSTPQVASR